MNRKESQSIKPDKELAAVCGLFCPACTVFIGTHEDPERLKVMAQRTNRSAEKLHCEGCRSDKRCFYCKDICKMSKCAIEKGVEFCGECVGYPCNDLKEFQAAMPHRIELWKSQERISEGGWEKWFTEMVEHFSCKDCGTLNSAYDPKCRNCGAEPSCEYVRLHKDEIVRYLEKWKAA